MLSKTKNHSCVELCIQSNEQDDFETRPSSNGIISKSLEDKEITITTFSLLMGEHSIMLSQTQLSLLILEKRRYIEASALDSLLPTTITYLHTGNC